MSVNKRTSTAERRELGRELGLNSRRSAGFSSPTKGSDLPWPCEKKKWLAIANRLTRIGREKNQRPTTQLEVKTVLNPIQHFVGFLYHSVQLRGAGGSLRVEVRIEPHKQIRGKCATCLEACPGYDRLEERRTHRLEAK